MKWHVGKSAISGLGAFSSGWVNEGEIIDVGIGLIRSGGSAPRHYVTKFGSWINHSWSPSAGVCRDPRSGVYYVRALRRLPPETEITVDYRDAPEFIEGPMEWYV